jgi:branched-chain amino acid transport system substrate-binding protein
MVLATILSIVGLTFAGCGGTPVIRIGVIAEMTGSIPAVGTSCRNAATLAAKEINSSGGMAVGGKKYKVELVVRDSGGKPEKAAAMARELIDRENVVAIVGPNSTSNAVPAADVAEKSRVVLVTPWSTSPKTTIDSTGKAKKYVFRVCVTAAYEGEQLAKFARGNLGAGKAAVLFDDSADVLKIQAEDFRKSFTAAGGSVVAYESFRSGDRDFTAQLATIKAAGPDVLFLTAYYNEVPFLLEQARGAGITAQVLGSNGWSTPDIIAESGPDIEGSYVFNMYSPQSGDPVTRKFANSYEAAYGSAPDDVAGLSYDAVGLLKKALESAKNPDRQALDTSLLRLREFAGVTGKMRFLADSRDPLRGAVILKVQNGQFVLFAQLFAKATREDVVAIVKEAVAYAKANGKEKALAEFSNPKGLFNRGELYIFAYDFNGNVIAHGGNKAFIGQNLINMKDPNGVMVIQELIKQAKKGRGWLDYMWDNPQTKKVEPKAGYVMKVDDTWWLGSGIYVK